MAGKADYLENLLLNCLFRGGGNVTALATTYVALFTTNPADDGTGGTEVTGTGYARVAVTSSSGNWKDPSTATQGQISNTNKIVFPVANAPWGTITGFGVYDAPTSGNLLYWGTCSLTVNQGDQPLFDISALVISED